MSEINYQIIKKRILGITIEISPSLASKFRLNIESKVQVKKPKIDQEEPIILLMKTQIRIPESDDFNISINSEFVIKIEDTADTIIEEVCIPSIQKELFDSLDNILLEMGYKKLELSRN